MSATIIILSALQPAQPIPYVPIFTPSWPDPKHGELSYKVKSLLSALQKSGSMFIIFEKTKGNPSRFVAIELESPSISELLNE